VSSPPPLTIEIWSGIVLLAVSKLNASNSFPTPRSPDASGHFTWTNVAAWLTTRIYAVTSCRRKYDVDICTHAPCGKDLIPAGLHRSRDCDVNDWHSLSAQAEEYPVTRTRHRAPPAGSRDITPPSRDRRRKADASVALCRERVPVRRNLIMPAPTLRKTQRRRPQAILARAGSSLAVGWHSTPITGIHSGRLRTRVDDECT
jgi:hypothetical protein